MKQWILMLVAALGLNGCTNLMELQAPKVSVTSVRPVAGKGLLPNFEIDLHLSNPNDQELSLRGASYALSLEGNPLVSGVASKLPALPAYGETDVTLTAVPDVAGALGIAWFSLRIHEPDPGNDRGKDGRVAKVASDRKHRIRL